MAQYPYSLADGTTRWRFMTYIPDGDGQRKQVKKGGFVDQAAAAKAEDALRAKFRKVKDRAPRGTVAQMLMSWVDTRNDIEVTSISDYRYRFAHYVIPYIGALPLHQASDPAVVANLYRTLRERGAKPRTRAEIAAAAADPTWHKGLAETSVYAVHLSLMAALRDLGVDVADIRSPKKRAKKNEHRRNKKQGRRGVWTISQVQTFLYSAKSTRTYPAWCLFAISGMRRGEVAGLRWSAVDLESGLIEVEYQRTTLTGGHGIHEGDPKQGSFRPLMVGPQVLQLLRAHRDRWIIEQAMFATRGRDDWAEHDFVFTNNTSGMPYYPGHYSHQFAVLAERAGLPRIALHDLRHSVATNARPLSIDIKTTQALIGHADASTLLNVYTHLPEYQAVHAALTVMESAVLKPVEELLEMVTGSA